MKNTAIIIPTRLRAKRFPNKPLVKINDVPMIIHVLNRAKESKVGEVFVATPDVEIYEVVKQNGGKAILTRPDHLSGSDRVYEAYKKELQNDVDLIINLQGDMPNIQPKAISNLVKYMSKDKCDIGTLASEIKLKSEMDNPNVVKVAVAGTLSEKIFLNAVDFFRTNLYSKLKVYHHVGIYAFTNKALIKYVSLKRSNLELERNLEQLRALENKMSIHVGYIDSCPLSVDTEEDLIEIRNLMEKNEKN